MKLLNTIRNCFIASLVIGMTGCSVDPELTDVYPEEVAWSSEANMELSLNKFYPLIGQTYYTSAIQQDALSDVLKMNSPTAEQNLLALGSTIITPASNLLGNWSWGYTWVKTCNEFLDGLQTKGGHLPEATRLRAEAEVRFFRAYVYFEMAKRYSASLVLFDKLPELGNSNHARSTEAEGWDFIAADLDYAANNLPPTVEAAKRGKLTKGAAYALKARAMLYAKRWKASTDAVEALDQLNMYDLHPNYAGLFMQRRSSPIENKESIVEFGYSTPNFGYSFDYFFCPPGDRGYAQVSPTEDLVSQYQMADGADFSWSNTELAAHPYKNREPRFYASILFDSASWKGRRIQAYEGGTDGWAVGGGTTCTGYYMRKLFDSTVKTQDVGFQPGELTYYFIRYAEVLLIYAEACVEQNRYEDGLAALNKVRRRAGFTTDLTAGSKEDFMRLLRHERMIELAFEGHRYWDLRRWGLASSVLNGTNVTGTRITKKTDGSFTYQQVDADNGRKRLYPERYNRFPIPSSEISTNLLIDQYDEWK
ncbi:MAG: RagB/SusD family nutrient uptake outer membrane protein [Candidatus Pseudobacter hemicellulosilyticus]|uniref:RagB/SusD family nutrient uptake outer membrane protein n=1 Tax=Candidatus Pseudobacter hemicellulosilyticus TaxID=3121375 RepID=A0AAJ5WS16_9BACT|nr:MAG: RagB/SusD family nutrient uptake outer membrane protein [Pseudobacter sp.]